MIYIACVLSGLLIGLIAKDLQYRGMRLELEKGATDALKATVMFLFRVQPVSPEDFAKKKDGSTGVGLLDQQMFLVRLVNKKLETISNVPLRELLGDRYSDLRITTYLPKDRDIDHLLSIINKLIT